MDSANQTNKLLLLKAALIALGISLFALHFSPAISSISFGLSIALGVYLMMQNHNEEKKSGLSVFTIPGLILILFLVWQLAISLFFAENSNDIAPKAMLKLPLLALPVLTYLFIKGKSIVNEWIAFFNLSICWLAVASVVHYLNHFAFLNTMVLESKPLPIYSLVYHIEFSVLLASAALVGIWRLMYHFRSIKSFTRYLLVVCVVINVVCLHVLSARTGMLAFWMGVGMLGFFKFKIQEFSKRGVFVALLLIIGMALLPSVKNRIVNTWQDISTVVSDGDINNKSFGQRWKAWEISIEILKENPMGVGWVNVENKMNEMYEKRPTDLAMANRVMPHNQFLDIAVQSGWVGLLLFFAFFVISIFISIKNRNIMLLSVLVAMMASMMFESLLERQAGVLIFVILVALGMANEDFQKNIRKKL